MTRKTEKPISIEQISKALLINGDTKLLLRKIKNGDKAAMVQLVMLYMADIIRHVDHHKQKRYNYQILRNIATTDLIDTAIDAFINSVESYVNSSDFLDKDKFDDDEELSFMDEYEKCIDKSLEPILLKANKYSCFFGNSHLLPKNIAMLNKLNRILTEKQKMITERLADYSGLLDNRIRTKDCFTQDYNLDLEINYYTKNNGNPIHTTYDNCTYLFNCEITDWIVPSMPFIPVLEDPCCYLLHDLIDHSRIGKKLFKIDSIWINITIDDQNFIKRKEFI